MILENDTIALRPIDLDEVIFFFEMATDSYATKFWYGEYTGEKVPDYDAFIQEWDDFYFVDDEPDMGRCFFIIAEGDIIGEINYSVIDTDDKSTELDILIAYEDMVDRGFGTAALRMISEYLFSELDVKKCWLAVPESNERAKKACEKAGFIKEHSFSSNNILWDIMTLRT